MGSKKDEEHGLKIAKTLQQLGVDAELRVASAHKVPLKVLEILSQHEQDPVVYITIAGMSNALSGFCDANTVKPVIACPPYSEKFAGADIFSSLRMPEGVAPLTILEPEQAALAAAKILALSDENLGKRIERYQKNLKEKLAQDDLSMQKSYAIEN